MPVSDHKDHTPTANNPLPLKRETHLGGTLTPFKGIWPELGEDVFVFHGAQVVGDVKIGAKTSVWHNVVIRGDVNHIRIGERSNIQDGTVVHVSTRTHPTEIGNDVLIGHMAMLHGCQLKDRAFVGMGATVMDGCVIESDGMLAAGAMLTPGKRIASGQLWVGSPARYARDLTEEELERNRKMAEHYYRLALQHEADSRGVTVDEAYP